MGDEHLLDRPRHAGGGATERGEAVIFPIPRLDNGRGMWYACVNMLILLPLITENPADEVRTTKILDADPLAWTRRFPSRVLAVFMHGGSVL